MKLRGLIAVALLSACGTPVPMSTGQSSAPIQETSQVISEVQRLLNQVNYPAGAADGKMGPLTRNAITSFENAERLPADGRIDNALLATLRARAAGGAAPLLAANDRDAPAGEGMLGVRLESANAAGVTLTRVFFSNDANNLRVADQHCAKFGKVAQFVSRENDRRRYNCVQP